MSEQHTRLAPSDRLHALAELQLHTNPEAACIAIASQHYGHWGRKHLSRDAMITLMREVCDHNGWKYNGSR